MSLFDFSNFKALSSSREILLFGGLVVLSMRTISCRISSAMLSGIFAAVIAVSTPQIMFSAGILDGATAKLNPFARADTVV